MKQGIVLVAVALGLAGCGQTTAQRNAAAARETQRAMAKLDAATLRAALAGVGVKRAELAHRLAAKRLDAVERAIRAGRPAPVKAPPDAEERTYLRTDKHLAAIERWIRSGAHGPGPGEAP